MHSISVRERANFEYRFGGGVYPVSETINAIRFYIQLVHFQQT